MEMPPQPRKKGAVMAKVKNVLFMVGMVLVASMVLHSSAQSLALVLFGHDASATVQVYKVQRDYWGVMLCVDSGTCGKDLGYVYAPTPPRVLC